MELAVLFGIGGVVVGFVIGLLVYRNNVKTLQAAESNARQKAAFLQAELEVLKQKVLL